MYICRELSNRQQLKRYNYKCLIFPARDVLGRWPTIKNTLKPPKYIFLRSGLVASLKCRDNQLKVPIHVYLFTEQAGWRGCQLPFPTPKETPFPPLHQQKKRLSVNCQYTIRNYIYFAMLPLNEGGVWFNKPFLTFPFFAPLRQCWHIANIHEPKHLRKYSSKYSPIFIGRPLWMALLLISYNCSLELMSPQKLSLD